MFSFSIKNEESLLDTRSEGFKQIQNIARGIVAVGLVFAIILSPTYLPITWEQLGIATGGGIGFILFALLMISLLEDGAED